MRKHLAFETAGGPLFYRVHVKTTLGAALLQFGNKAEDPLSALNLQPAHGPARQNLDVMRRNRSMRSKPEGGPGSRKHGADGEEEPRDVALSASAFLTYDEALARAVQGQVDAIVIDSLRN